MNHWRSLAGAATVATVLGAMPARAVEQELIKQAIDRGVAAIRTAQTPQGTWPYASNPNGADRLAVLTLLECGVAPDDPAVRKAADVIRRDAASMRETYSLALAVLFLDRLGSSADVPILQVLAVRLLFGQTSSGGWGYNCPCLKTPVEIRMLAGGQADAAKDLQELVSAYAGGATNRPGGPPGTAAEDHSNTQFATLGLWVARRHKVPVDLALKAIEVHYRQCQSPADGGWTYNVRGGQNSTPTMTAAGVLGLAAGKAVSADADKRAAGRAAAQDPALLVALQALGNSIGDPVGPHGLVPSATGRSYYFLWSLERVAMCLGLDTLCRHDWYAWGAEILIVNQDRATGRWNGEYAQCGADTCFALLFLVRSNLAKGLTAKLHGIFHDPGRVTLKSGGIGGGASAGKALKPAIEPDSRPGKGLPSLGTLDSPPPVQAFVTPDAARLAGEIVHTPRERFTAVLDHVRDARGVVNTEALAAAIPQLPREHKKAAREALAERLSRLRVASLTDYLKDDNAEIRRGAALALAMKDSKENIGQLLPLVRDPAEAVALAARAALKDLTGQDFGPAAGASAEERERAFANWSDWWKKKQDSSRNNNR